MDKKLVLASRHKRNLSFIIDDFIISIFIMAIFYEFFISVEYVSFRQTVKIFMDFLESKILILILLKVIYHTFFIWYKGATFGKLLVNIEVIDISTQARPIFLIALYRSILRVISEFFFYLGFLYAYFNDLNQTFHDKISNVMIVDKSN